LTSYRDVLTNCRCVDKAKDLQTHYTIVLTNYKCVDKLKVCWQATHVLKS